MESKSSLPYALLQGRNANPLIEAYFEFCHLKQLYRQGWLKRGISKDRCESVAEHTFGVAVLAFLLAESYFPGLDANRVLRMALLHDFGEIYAGDIIPSDEVLSEEKHRLEYESVARVFARLPNGGEYLKLWQEFEDGQTAEARFVRQIDRLEMALQASVYELQGDLNLQEFFDTTSQALSDPKLVEILEAIQVIRGSFPS